MNNDEASPAEQVDAQATGGHTPDGQQLDGQAPGTSNREPTRRGAGRRAVQRTVRSLIEWVSVAVGALAVALLIKAFLVQAFYIPSESMAETLQINDRVLVSKLSYRIGDPSRGDIVVFHKPPSAPGQIEDFIKRVVAVPGETISFADGRVLINGEAIDEPYARGITIPSGSPLSGPGCTSPASADRCTVADGFYFVMGDNRGNSTDSRVFGPIDGDEIIGRAFVKIWPLSSFGFL